MKDIGPLILNLKHNTVYLAGPMRGEVLYNFPMFFAASMMLRDKFNLNVLNPAERDMAIGFDPGRPLDWEKNAEVWTMASAFAWDFDAIKRSSAIFLLPGWQKSQGVQAELLLATTLELRVFALEGLGGTLVHELKILNKTVTFVVNELSTAPAKVTV